MSNFLISILQASGVFTVFYGLFLLFFRKLTFHSLNRLVLLCLIPLAFIIPNLKWDWKPAVVSQIELPTIEEWIDSQTITNTKTIATNANASAISSDWGLPQLFQVIYFVGLLLFVLRLVLHTVRLFQLKQKSVVQPRSGYQLVIGDFPSAFSCFRWVFIPLGQAEAESEVIIKHERAHVKLLHTLDLLCTEIFIALMWFNPFVFLFRKSLRAIHEFQADECVLKAGTKKSDYLLLMLQSLQSKQVAGLYSHFNSPNIQKRVKMITKNKSNFTQRFRYLLILPIVVMLSMAFAPKGMVTLGELPFKEELQKEDSLEDKKPSIMPIKAENLTRFAAGFGYRTHPIYKTKVLHTGVDFTANMGTKIMATANGKVIKAEISNRGYGHHIEIDHGGGYITKYAHMKGFAVKLGQEVSRGKTIGYVGSTGASTAPHLHYEIILNGKKIDPLPYLKDMKGNEEGNGESIDGN